MRMRASVALAMLVIATSIDVAVATRRTFVSTNGYDAAACSVSAPCRSFGAALAQTDSGGEIIVVDSGGYGPVTVNKSVAIRSPAGVYAGISVLFSPGIGVSVEIPGGRVTLEGLTITGLGGQHGVVFKEGAELRISRVQIQGMTQNGILISQSEGGSLIVSDSVIARSGVVGIWMQGNGSKSSVLVERSRIEGNGGGFGAGILVQENAVGHVRDSTLVRNFRGVDVESFTLPTSVDVENTLVAENVVGLFSGMNVGALARIRAARSTIVGNTLFAFEAQDGSSILSRGDNSVFDNAGGEAFTGIYSPQ
jgi:hypothetical protein